MQENNKNIIVNNQFNPNVLEKCVSDKKFARKPTPNKCHFQSKCPQGTTSFHVAAMYIKDPLINRDNTPRGSVTPTKQNILSRVRSAHKMPRINTQQDLIENSKQVQQTVFTLATQAKLLKIIHKLQSQIDELKYQIKQLKGQKKDNNQYLNSKKNCSIENESKLENCAQIVKKHKRHDRAQLKNTEKLMFKGLITASSQNMQKENFQTIVRKLKEQNKNLLVEVDHLKRMQFISMEQLKKNHQYQINTFKDKYLKLLSQHKQLSKSYYDTTLQLRQLKKLIQKGQLIEMNLDCSLTYSEQLANSHK